MNLLNNLIKSAVDAGVTNLVYFLFELPALLSVIVCIATLGRKHKLSLGKSLLIVLLIYPAAYGLMYFQAWAETGFQVFGGQNFVRTVVYIPLIAMVAGKILKMSWKEVCDIISPCMPLNHFIGHLGCNFAGCCYGYTSSWGVYNPITESIRFPNQLCESLVALAIVIYIIRRARKKNYGADGLSYPIMMIIFGGTRFFLEFARDNEKIWLGCSSLAFHALFMAVVGVIWIIVAKKRERPSDLSAPLEVKQEVH